MSSADMRGWISFKEKEPPLKQRVLVLKYYPGTTSKSYVEIDSYHGEFEYEWNRVGKIVYWMPLPRKPKGEEDEQET